MYLGVDEAGKGPVLGPMVAAAVLADPSNLPAAIDDSKRLSPNRRESLDTRIREHDGVAVGVAFVMSDEIDRPDADMNTLTLHAQAQAARSALAEHGRLVDDLGATAFEGPIHIVADAADTSEARFARRLAAVITEPTVDIDAESLPAIDVSAAHGADENDPIVGAASIVAKVARDERMAAIDTEYSDYPSVGSGYPGDATTRSFLRQYVADHGTVPDCARRSWSTCDDVLAAAEQSALDEF